MLPSLGPEVLIWLGQVMQGRITDLNQQLQEERRERRLFQEETVNALKSHLPGDGSLLFTPVSDKADSSWHSDARTDAAASKGPGASSGEFEVLDQNGDGVLDRDEFARLNRVFNK